MIVVLICISLMTKEVKHLFTYLLARFFFDEVLCKTLVPSFPEEIFIKLLF